MKPGWSRRVSRRHKLALATLAVCAIAFSATTVASAASLGSTLIREIGAASGVVSACDDDGVDVVWDTSSATYSSTVGGYVYTRILMDDIAVACNGSRFAVVVSQADGTSVAETSGASLPAARPVTITMPTQVEIASSGQLVLTIYE